MLDPSETFRWPKSKAKVIVGVPMFASIPHFVMRHALLFCHGFEWTPAARSAVTPAAVETRKDLPVVEEQQMTKTNINCFPLALVVVVIVVICLSYS